MNTLLVECREKLGEVRAGLLVQADSNAEISSDFVNCVLQGFDCVKGNANLLRCYPLKHLSNLSESVVVKVRDGHLALSSTDAEVLLSAVDRMYQMVARQRTPLGRPVQQRT
jgi:chemotaxis protein histidine kinase CheA